MSLSQGSETRFSHSSVALWPALPASTSGCILGSTVSHMKQAMSISVHQYPYEFLINSLLANPRRKVTQSKVIHILRFFLFLIDLFNLFIFGCVGSSLLRVGFL